jgi:sulfur carrier protein
VRIRLNGAWRELPEGATVADGARATGVDPGTPGVAAALDGDVVPRERWAETPLREGAALEVVRAAAGG